MKGWKMREYDIRSELLEMNQSILQVRDVSHTCFTESSLKTEVLKLSQEIGVVNR